MERRIMLVLFFIFIISLVNAQPPFTTSATTNNGIIIEAPVQEYLKVGNDYMFHIHAHNISSGLILTNLTTNCTIHVYEPLTGKHLVEDKMPFDSNGLDFEYIMNGTNLSVLGQYSVLYYCNTTAGVNSIGGFVEYPFYVTLNGEDYTEAQSTASLLLIAYIALLFAIGASFGKERWKLKSFFYLSSILISIILLNSMLVMFSISKSLVSMGQTALILGIVIFLIYLLYIFINYLIELFNQIRNSKQKRKEQSDPY